MSALGRLRALEISRNGGAPEPTKPTKPPFDGFDGAGGTVIPEISSVYDEVPRDSGYERRRAKALALLDDEPSRQIAVIAEAPKPGEAVGYVCTAVRCVAAGDIAMPAEKYDAFALLALLEQHGHA